MKRTRTPTVAEILLGKRIKDMRISKDITRKQLGKMIKETEQTVDKYENGGAYVPLAKMETIAKAMGEEIPKRIIRKINKFRNLEKKLNIDQVELVELYGEAFPDSFPEYDD